MIYENPVIPGFYPDPSVCYYKGKYYLVTSSFQYFPGVPLFESDNLADWKQIGHVLTRESQVSLKGIRSSGGIFAPTIRVHNDRFYMITNDNSNDKNFYVYTDDIYGEWSDPIYVEQKGIDPSLFWDDDGKVYLQTNGTDPDAKCGVVVQSEIDIETGKPLSDEQFLWSGSGGRYIESPHVYKIGSYYYLMVAEGGTEYGHMITYARSENVWGPYTAYPDNPVLTNRNKAPYIFQGIGHGDLIYYRKPAEEYINDNSDSASSDAIYSAGSASSDVIPSADSKGAWFILCLGFRQIGHWEPYHHLGREVFLIPASFNEDGWFTAGNDGTAEKYYNVPEVVDTEYTRKKQVKEETGVDLFDEPLTYTFQNTTPGIEWVYLRDMKPESYELGNEAFTLHGTDVTLDSVASPTFIAMRQRDFYMKLEAHVSIDGQERSDSFSNHKGNTWNTGHGATNIDNTTVRSEAGLTLYMDESEHYDLSIERVEYDDHYTYDLILRLCIGDIKHIQNRITLLDEHYSSNPELTSVISFEKAKTIMQAKERSASHFTSGSPAYRLAIEAKPEYYSFFLYKTNEDGITETKLLIGRARTKYLSSEVASGFTGVMLGLYATGNITARFTDYNCRYKYLHPMA